MPEEKNPWDQLVHAARDAGAVDQDTTEEQAPKGFVSRVVAMRDGLWKIARTLLWRRWSLIAAGLAILLYLVVYFVLKLNPPEGPSVPPLPLPPVP